MITDNKIQTIPTSESGTTDTTTFLEQKLEQEMFDNKGCDFHMHSYLSDGVNSIEHLIDKARKNGLKKIAITDHDMTYSYELAKEILAKNEITDLIVIPGVEISTDDYHILGLNIDPHNESLEEVLHINREFCIARSEIMCKNLKNAGYDISFDKVHNLHPNTKRLGKFHIADYLAKFETGRIKKENGNDISIQNVIKSYLKKGKVGYVNSMNIFSNQAIPAIHNAGGIAVLAHPSLDVKEMSEIDSLVKIGLDGIEMQPNYSAKDYLPFYNYAKAKGLVITHGSDFHRDDMNKPILSYNTNCRR
ncbi:MAG: PHP domain-containing protein [Candidatus Woesearchaeota archaeon]|jgi:hypothetical protein